MNEMDAKITLNVIGLSLGILGTGLLVWSSIQYPFTTVKNDKGIPLDEMPRDDPNRPDIKKKKKELMRVRSGFVVLGIGFLLQLIALFS